MELCPDRTTGSPRGHSVERDAIRPFRRASPSFSASNRLIDVPTRIAGRAKGPEVPQLVRTAILAGYDVVANPSRSARVPAERTVAAVAPVNLRAQPLPLG